MLGPHTGIYIFNISVVEFRLYLVGLSAHQHILLLILCILFNYYMLFQLMVTLVFAILSGVIYLQLDDSAQPGIRNR